MRYIFAQIIFIHTIKYDNIYELHPQHPWPPDFILNNFKLFLGFMTSISIKPINEANVLQLVRSQMISLFSLSRTVIYRQEFVFSIWMNEAFKF